MEWILVKTLLSLGAVIALMFGVVYLLRKYVYQGSQSSTSLVAIDVLGQRALAPKRSVIILKVLQTVLVVGISDNGMQTLATIDDERTLAELDQQLKVRESKGPRLPWSKPSQDGVAGSAFDGQLHDIIKTFSTRKTRVHSGAKKGGKTA